MNCGQIVFYGVLSDFVDDFNGKVWVKMIEKFELLGLCGKYQIIFECLMVGKVCIYVLVDIDLGDGFEFIQLDLEDVYFVIICGG